MVLFLFFCCFLLLFFLGFFFFVFCCCCCWLKPLTDGGGEETRVPGENPRRRASENATYLSPKIQVPTGARTRNLAFVAGAYQEADELTFIPRVAPSTHHLIQSTQVNFANAYQPSCRWFQHRQRLTQNQAIFSLLLKFAEVSM